MDFSLKIQNLGIENIPVDGHLAISHEFDIPDDQIETKRGHLFAILDISANGNFDVSAIAKLFIDSVQENYFRISEDTPLHAIEKSLNKARTQISQSPEAELRLSFCTALIWNKILYTSYFGKPAAYLIRGTGARNLGINITEQEIWTNSSILDDEDVILIGTEHFATRFPATEIINNLGSISQEISQSENSNDLVAILIKVDSNEEKRKPNLIENIKNTDIKGTISTSFWKLKEKVLQNDKLSDKFKIYQSKKVAPISSISGLTKTIASEDLKSGSNLSKIKRISKNGTKNKKIKRLAVGLVMLSIFGFINMKLFYNNKKEPETRALLSSKITKTDNKNGEVIGTNAKSDKIDALINLQSVSGKSSPMLISYMKDDKIMTLDTVSHTLYQTDISTKDSKSLTDKFERPMLLKCGETYCYVYGNKTLYVVDPKTPDRIEKYLINIEDIVDIEPFGNAVYFLTSNNIYIHTLLSDESQSWLKEGESIIEAKSFSINSDVYVLSNRNIFKYANEKLQKDFVVDNSHLLEPIQIEISAKYIFVLDSAQNNLVIYNKNNGSFYKKVSISDETSANDPDSFVLVENSTNLNPTVIIKSGTYLYQLDNASLYQK